MLVWFQWEHAAHTAAWLLQCVSVSGGYIDGTLLCPVLENKRKSSNMSCRAGDGEHCRHQISFVQRRKDQNMDFL